MLVRNAGDLHVRPSNVWTNGISAAIDTNTKLKPNNQAFDCKWRNQLSHNLLRPQ
jgi:hypothetical protein